MNMKKAIGRTLLAAVICCVALAGSAFAASIGGATVNADALNLRAAPNTGAGITAVAARDQAVVVQEIQNDYWFKVICNGVTGYMSGDYLSYSKTMDADFGSGSIKGSGVRMRAGASLSSNILGKYNSGTKMNVVGIDGEWYKVEYNGIYGYVHSDYFTFDKQSITPPSWSIDPGQKIVDTAMKYMGVPYVWAGTSPNGFDCSGFVFYAYKENGYDINRTAASIYSNGTYVDRSQLQVGDAICFTNSSYSYIGHVGIYIGDDKFIHASSAAGYVTINSLSERYYNNHYYGARRIV